MIVTTAHASLSDAELIQLAREHGPFYLLDIERFATNVRLLRTAFEDRGLSVELGWSYKTNWIPLLCQEAWNLGMAPEVVSRTELDLAMAIGADGSAILFNGPIKTEGDLDHARELGATIHLDAWREVEHIERSSTLGPPWRIGIRCNVDVGAARGRFGFAPADVARIVARLSKLPHVGLRGLHMHKSGIRGHESYALRLKQLASLAEDVLPRAEYLDIGGGLAGAVPKALADQMSAPPSTRAQYVDAISDAYQECFAEDGPQLILEPGMALVADAMDFVCSVHDTKVIDGTRHAVIDGSIYNIKPTLHGLDMPFRLLRADGDVAPGVSTVGGYTCMEIDVLHSCYPAQMKRDDVLVFSNCGAYTTVLTPTFIRPAAAVIACKSGSPHLLRRADTLDDWLRPFQMGSGAPR